jgi:hypothetical protein
MREGSRALRRDGVWQVQVRNTLHPTNGNAPKTFERLFILVFMNYWG